MVSEEFIKQAEKYLSLGFSVIPVGQNKKPFIRWEEFQGRKASNEEIEQWAVSFKEPNIAVVTGKISSLIVVDIDPRHGGNDDLFHNLNTVQSKTGGGGYQFFFRYVDGVKNYAGIRTGIDIRGDGGYAILPPSLHSSGKLYEWVIGPDDAQLAPFPPFVKEWLQKTSLTTNQTDKEKHGNFDPKILEGVPEGQRNNAAASFAGKLLRRYPAEEWDTEAWSILTAWNQSKNLKPLPTEELRTVFESIKERELKGKEEENEKSVALQLVEKIRKENIVFFHNEHKEGFAAVKGDGREIYKIRSRDFKNYISYFIYKQNGEIVSLNVINNILQTLEGRAIFDGPRHELAVRVVAQDSTTIWYDLGAERMVHIDKDGWTISETPPILFRRYTHQSTQIEPKHGGDLKRLLGFINLKHDEEKLLFLVFTVAAFIPSFPHPILVFYGPQGSGKTTPQRLLKSLVDPSVLKTLSAPDSMREFIQLASHHYFVFLDNLSSLPGWLSDSLAKAVTGDGFSKRELFSDDDDVIYNFQRTIVLNGIPLVIQRADLLERSILLGLERISKEDRREEQEFWQEFEKQKPFLLGAIFNTVAKALQIYPTIHLTSHPRMADFARWGCAIAEALGYTKESFLSAYDNNIVKQNREAIDASPVATAVMAFMEERNEWEGTATDLYKELEKIAESSKTNTKSHDWPKDSSALSRKLRVVQTNLAEEGIQISKDETVRPKSFIIKKNSQNPDNGDTPTQCPKNEAKGDVSAIEGNTVNPDTNADNNIQSQSDGMTGLSGLLSDSENQVTEAEKIFRTKAEEEKER